MLRRRTVLSVSVSAALLAATPLLTACGSDAHPGAAAIVGGERITVAQLQAKVKDVRRAQSESPQGGQLISNTGQLSLVTLNGMIFRRVLERSADRAGVTVSRADVQKWRTTAERELGGPERLKAVWLQQQSVAPDEVDATVRNQLLLDGLAKKIGADRASAEGQRRLVDNLARTSRAMGVDVNPRFGRWNDRRVILGETKDPWISHASGARQQA
ncbi:SurA N-terminal domain-containing protein [Streptomyces ramulosus]|uniref:SurA N-terminal domain-containing protein n=1 Tax=Streptomyces ramulosus TaxID=47762 RepID=A0ABW1FPA0_9ACTN